MAMNENNPKLRLNSYSKLGRRPNQSAPACWWKGPGLWFLYTMVHTALVAVAKQRGWDTSVIKYIRVANVEGDPRIWFWPTDESDPDRVELRRGIGRYSVNLSEIMINWKMALAPRQRNHYDVLTDDAGESPVGPALYINSAKVLETKWDKKRTPARETSPTQN